MTDTNKVIGCVQHDCAECKARDAELNRLKQKLIDGVTIQHYIDLDNEIDRLRAETQKTVDEWNEYIQGYKDECFETIDELIKERQQLRANKDALERNARLGKVAMRFVDRAGDVHPGIDDAETICAEFYKAMSDALTLEAIK